MAGEGEGEGRVIVGCPRCGRPYLMAVEPLRVGYAVGLVAAGCHCVLSREENLDLADRAARAYAAGEREG